MSTMKTCKMCCMEIPAEAKKCPRCQHFQNRVSMIMFHPGFAFIFGMLPWLFAVWLFSRMFDRGETYQRYADQIVITEHRMVFGELRGAPTVDVIGTITNKSPVPWKDIRFQIDVQDSEGRRVDTGQEEQYPYVLPPGDALSFKVGFKREFPETNYVSHTIRVVSAKDDRARW